MAYKKVTRQSYGSRILNSIFGVLIGIVLIIGMSILLFWNEGRYNPADLAVEAQELTSSSTGLDGELIWHKCELTGGNMALNDDAIIDSNYLYFSRKVEVYAWIETSESKSKDNLGGSQETETTYSYALGWTTDPQDPSTFYAEEEQGKPKASFGGLTAAELKNSSITSEDYNLDSDDLTIDGVKNLPLTAGVTVEESALNENVVIYGNYIYYKAEDSTGPATPSFNDRRVSYTYIPSGVSGVIVGKLSGDSIVKYTNEDASLYRFFEADSIEEVVSILDKEHKTSAWLFRIIGTILMCVGFALITGPLSTILMVVPFLGKASQFLLGIVSFLIGFVYSVLVIVISMIFHNIIALIIAIAIIVLLVLYGIKKKKKSAARAK
ncbi:MAG: TMEM43 family protein [Christensenellales bacterium]|jgi:hypothetical protein